MKYYLILFSGILLFSCQSEVNLTNRVADFNFDWKFSLAENEEAWTTDFDDNRWRTLNLPHDWVIENSMDSTVEFWQGTGRFPSEGIGWYRKSFKTPITENEVCYVHFDGIYNNATVWINGQKLGFHPYGYSPFYYDLTPYLYQDGQENILAVQIDHTRYSDSRWYTGAGIYRNVELITTNKLHVPIWGVYVTTPKIAAENATVHTEISLKNDFDNAKSGIIKAIIFDENEKRVGALNTKFEIDSTSKIALDFDIKNPQLWDIDNPYLYKLLITIELDDEIVDTYEQRFGIRSIRFDANNGFFLNEKNIKIKGVCLHHDGGLVGAAVPKGVWKRRLEILKKAGCNAIRSAHNPASTEFLELCDEMGFLVQDEFFDEWDNPKDKRFNMNQQSEHYETQGYVEHFHDWAATDIKTTMLSHRNHPSIIQWSIGNEIEWTYPRNQKATGFFDNMNWTGNYFWSKPPFSTDKIKSMLETLPKEKYDIGETAQQLADWTRLYDTTRYVTANCILPSVSYLNGYVDALDMVGYSYRRVLYQYGHENYPDVPIMGMESVPQYHEWKAIMENPSIAGTYLWTGIEYMGEVRSDFPAKSNGGGLLDLAGFPHPSYQMYKSLWNDEPHIHFTTNVYDEIKFRGSQLYKVNEKLEVEEFKKDAWQQVVWGWQTVNEHWNYQKDDTVIIEVLTNCNAVELFLNDKSLGTKNRADFPDNIIKWAVIYEPGEIKAIGINGDEKVNFGYQTFDDGTSIIAKIDTKKLKANQYDVAHIEVQLLDKNGNPTQDNHLVEFEVSENLRILGVDNGSSTNLQNFQSNKIMTDKGRALLIVQAKDITGKGKIVVQSNGMETVILNLELE